MVCRECPFEKLTTIERKVVDDNHGLFLTNSERCTAMQRLDLRLAVIGAFTADCSREPEDTDCPNTTDIRTAEDDILLATEPLAKHDNVIDKI